MKITKLTSIKVMAFLSAFIVVIMLYGCGGGGGSTSATDLSAPLLTNPRYQSTSSTLTSDGGTITLKVDATDNVGVTAVKATIKKSGVVLEEKNMALTSGSTYTTTYDVEANEASGSVQYTVSFVADDAAGNHSSAATTSFSVPGLSPPPIPTID